MPKCICHTSYLHNSTIFNQPYTHNILFVRAHTERREDYFYIWETDNISLPHTHHMDGRCSWSSTVGTLTQLFKLEWDLLAMLEQTNRACSITPPTIFLSMYLSLSRYGSWAAKITSGSFELDDIFHRVCWGYVRRTTRNSITEITAAATRS